MKLNLSEVPFSTRGSYMAFSYMKGKFHGKDVKEGLYFRSVHGAADVTFTDRISPVAMIFPTYQGREIPYTYEAAPQELKIITEYGTAGITFVDADTFIIKGNIRIKLHLGIDDSCSTYVQPWKVGDKKYHMINSFGCNNRYMMYIQNGSAEVEQKWNVNNTDYCNLHLGTEEGEEYLVSIQENYEDWIDKKLVYDYENTVEKNKIIFQEFYESMPSIPKEYAKAAEMAAFVDWVSIVKPCGILKRESMFMSKNWMCNVWSWDHCFNAMALAYNNPKEAWDQFMVLFDFQKPSGNIPDCINDQKIIHNFCKPPIHGWTLKKLIKIMEVTQEQLAEAYEKLSKWTNWWLNYRDLNGDGLCEYNHGNDSGWDNSTAFREVAPVTLPDLASFLIIQMDVLSEVAEKLNLLFDMQMWKERSAVMQKKMLQVLFEDNEPIALAGFEMEKVESESLILYLPILLADKLPQKVKDKMIEAIKGDKFNTAYGLATESTKSCDYEADGYWRGPIWAPSTMIILDGMMECGEKEFVEEVTHKFCRMVQKSGCAENYDALTGEGLRDRAYTWTASAMLVMAHEYLMEG